MKYLVSACLAGRKCRYDGASRPCAAIVELLRAEKAVPICPESLSGLPVPRPPAEWQDDGRILDKTGRDVSEAFAMGAERAFQAALQSGCSKAILKAHSPSCGVGHIYDGSFTGKLRPGNGLFAQKLLDAGFSVIDEEDFLKRQG